VLIENLDPNFCPATKQAPRISTEEESSDSGLPTNLIFLPVFQLDSSFSPSPFLLTPKAYSLVILPTNNGYAPNRPDLPQTLSG
jgi:hypothetical protein